MNDLLKQLMNIKNVEVETPEAKEELETNSEKKLLDMRSKANEVVHSTNTGYGKELIPVNILTDTVLDLIPSYASILNIFMEGFHGNQMGTSDMVPIAGDIGFAQSSSEWTTGVGTIAQGNRKLPTASVVITQYNLMYSVDISRREMAYSVDDLQALILKKVSIGMTRTIESAMINADPNNSTAGNVSLVDAQPSATWADWASDHRLLGWTGLRKSALAGTSGTDFVDVGTLAFDDFMTTRGKLNSYSSDLGNLALIMDFLSYNKAMTLTEFTYYSALNGQSTTNTGALTRIAGVDLYVHKDFPATNTAGKVSTTGSNNTKGSFLYVWKPAMQRGYGKDGLDITVVKLPWRGFQAIATMDVGFTVVNKLASVTDPTVVLGYDAS